MEPDENHPLFLIYDAGHSRASVARLFEVHRRTVDRWIAAGRMPTAVRLHLEMLAGRSPNWHGFRFRGPYIITPTGQKYHAQQICSIEWLTRLIRPSLKNTTAKTAEPEALNPPCAVG